jgi:hypothetical protein
MTYCEEMRLYEMRKKENEKMKEKRIGGDRAQTSVLLSPCTEGLFSIG